MFKITKTQKAILAILILVVMLLAIFIVFEILNYKEFKLFMIPIILFILSVLSLIFKIIHIKTTRTYNQIMKTIADNIDRGIIITNSENGIIYANDEFLEMTGYTFEEVKFKNPSFFSSGVQDQQFYRDMWNQIMDNGYWEGEIVDKRKDGSFFHKRMQIIAISSKKNIVKYFVALHSNIDQVKQLESEKYKYQYYSLNTNLPNENSLLKDYENLDAHESFYIAYAKIINQANFEIKHGKKTYNKTLIALSNEIRSIVPEARIYKVENDVLVIILACVKCSIDSFTTNLSKVKDNFIVDDKEVFFDVKYGVSRYPTDSKLFEVLMKNAQIALNSIISDRESKVKLYESRLGFSFMKEEKLQEELYLAIKNKKINVFYQPQIDGSTDTLVGVESLARWESDTFGYVPPNIFIFLAEKLGYMEKLNEVIFERVFSDYQKIRVKNDKMSISINVGLHEMLSVKFHQFLEAQIKKYKIPRNLFILELTESNLVTDMTQLKTAIAKIKELGFLVSMDDFGTGYNGLTVLNEIPFDEIKIDRNFMKDEMTDKDLSIIKTVVDLGEAMNLRVIAEGVETVKQKDFLVSVGCLIIQGYLYSRPVDFKTLLDFLDNSCYEK